MSALTPVSEAQFYAAIGPRNIHPRAERERSVWVNLDTHAVVGLSTPGYANTWTPDGPTPKTYMLDTAIAKATGSAA